MHSPEENIGNILYVLKTAVKTVAFVYFVRYLILERSCFSGSECGMNIGWGEFLDRGSTTVAPKLICFRILLTEVRKRCSIQILIRFRKLRYKLVRVL